MMSVYSMPLLDSDLDSVRELFELNVFGVLGTTQAFAPLLLKSKGSVVNISSLASISPIPWHGPYCGTKAALNQISDTLRQELDPFGVKVILVSCISHPMGILLNVNTFCQVITGAVNSNIHRNDKATLLPENSLYAPIYEVIKKDRLWRAV